MWSHRDLIEGVFTLDDLLDAHEMLAVQAENQKRSIEASQLKEGIY